MAKKSRPSKSARRAPNGSTPLPDHHLNAMVGDGQGLEGDRTIKRPPKPKKTDGGEPPIRERREVKRWESRLVRANKLYDQWEKDFECRHLDDYYEGKQWRGLADNEAKKKYVINMIFATVETLLPSLLFSNPKVKVEARPDHQRTAGSDAAARATLVEQTLQTFIDDPKVRFLYETDLALRDAYPRYALVEVGYSADWIDNPNAGKPALDEHDQPIVGDGEEALKEPDRVPEEGTERVYVRRLDAACYRVSPGTNALTSNDWVAYYDWAHLEDVKKNPEYDHTENLSATGVFRAEEIPADDVPQRDEDIQARVGMVKLWKIWDLRRKVRHVIAEGHPWYLQRDVSFKALPHAALKFYERRNAFYPLPPIYNWLSPQDEINETRDMQRVHRRRALRRYMHEPSVTNTELEKLETGEDMVSIKVPNVTPPPIVPIQDAPLDQQNWTELAATRDDLNQIAGVSGETRNQPTAPTATQANIVNVRTSIRESRARSQVAEWLAEVCRLMLVTILEHVQGPFMVKRTLDPFAAASDPKSALSAAQLWTEIDAEDLDELDVDIKIDVASLSPVSEDAQRNQWNVVLQLLTNPLVVALLSVPAASGRPDEPSPLLRRTMALNGITSDQEIREVWRVLQQLKADAAAAAASQAAQGAKPEPLKMSLALKGEDLMNPLLGPFFMKILAREENMQIDAALLAAPPSPLTPENGNRSGGLTLPGPSGPTTGTPSRPPVPAM